MIAEWLRRRPMDLMIAGSNPAGSGKVLFRALPSAITRDQEVFKENAIKEENIKAVITEVRKRFLR